jgi:UDP-galactopyranose mutase
MYPFPSSIDKTHFIIARTPVQEPDDQKTIPHPRLGFYGVLDERMDLVLLEEMSSLRPDWHFIMIGPVVKIDPAALPKKDNIHYLGHKDYKDLPAYLAGWDIALMPFALNESTKFISPTKTPEYLAGGKPVISTAIKDVVTPYGSDRLVHIAGSAEEFIDAAEKELTKTNSGREEWLGRVDAYLSGISWDRTFQGMESLINLAVKSKPILNSKTTNHV